MIEQDARRKLDRLDYSRIRMYDGMDFTIREIANTFAISTKFVKKILDAEVEFHEDGSVRFIMTEATAPQIERLPCSGCGMGFNNRSGLLVHWAIWTSGGIKELECQTVMPTLMK